MNISEIIWLEDIVDKLKWKHNVDEYEVIEILNNKPLFRFIEKGHRKDENVYAALGQTNSGRYLTVFFVFKRTKQALIISAKDMTKKERKWYGRR
ncbi:MAG: BrnT family toxin [Desulfobacteraceae bacterium]